MNSKRTLIIVTVINGVTCVTAWCIGTLFILLTIICIVTVVLLLFLPEQSPDMELVSVSKDNNYVIDVDKAFAMSQQRSKDIVLEVTIGGSFITQELTSLVSNRYCKRKFQYSTGSLKLNFSF